MVEILKMKFDQDLCLNFDMNSTLGSVVPLAMFIKDLFTMITITISTMKLKFTWTIISIIIIFIIMNSTWSNGLETEEEEVPDHVLVVVVQPGDSDDDDDDDNDDEDDDDDDDIYIMMKCLSVCLFVTKNEHFLLGVSCNHLNPP